MENQELERLCRILGSLIKVKIIILLQRYEDGLHVSDIARKLKTSPSTVAPHIIELENEDILKCKFLGRSKVCKLNKESEQCKAILNLLSKWFKEK